MFWQNENDLEVLTDPQRSELLSAIHRSRFKAVKGVLAPGGSMHVWDAYQGDHNLGLKKLGLGRTRQWFGSPVGSAITIMDHRDGEPLAFTAYGSKEVDWRQHPAVKRLGLEFRYNIPDGDLTP